MDRKTKTVIGFLVFLAVIGVAYDMMHDSNSFFVSLKNGLLKNLFYIIISIFSVVLYFVAKKVDAKRHPDDKNSEDEI